MTSDVISPLDAWALRTLLIGREPGSPGAGVSGPLRPLAEYLGSLGTAEERAIAWGGYLSGHPDPDGLVLALAEADPSAPAPPAATAYPFATVADVLRFQSQLRWLWQGWIPACRITGLAAFEGTGKTRQALDLARRIYHGLPWPDGQPPTLPPGIRTVWICSDAHQDELGEIMAGLRLPGEAVVFPTSRANPYGGTDLDRPETIADLARCVAEVHPGMVFVDTLTSATSCDLSDQRTMKPLRAKLAPLAQVHGATIVLLLHLNRQGQALGRRIKGLTRTLLHLECPDPDTPERLRFWVEKSYARKPAALGVTMTDAGNEYDANPPAASEPDRGGRRPEARERASRFIAKALARDNDQLASDLCAGWEEAGGNSRTFWRAVDELVEAGELSSDGGTGTGRRRVLHWNTSGGDEDGPPGHATESPNSGGSGRLF